MGVIGYNSLLLALEGISVLPHHDLVLYLRHCNVHKTICLYSAKIAVLATSPHVLLSPSSICLLLFEGRSWNPN